MKIDLLEIPEGYKGLRHAVMSNLSKVVLLAGPNGGGKSRVLQAVLDNCNREDPEPPAQLRKSLAEHKKQLAQLEQHLNKNPMAGSDHAQSELRRLRHLVEQGKDRLQNVPSIEPELFPPPLAVQLTMFDTVFQDCTSATVRSMRDATKNISRTLDLGQAINLGPPAVFSLLANNLLATSKNTELTDQERDLLDNKISNLNILTERILGDKFKLKHLEIGPEIFGHPLENANALSAGQRILLSLLYVLFFQAEADKDVIILWDEPENHLHPEAVINILESLRDACPNAQIWIATHSIHILSHFQEHGIWFAREGEVTRDGRVAEQVLSSLIGEEDQLWKLTEFLAQPAQRALRLFAGQCLISPGAIHTLPGDPQTTQIFELLSRDKDRPLKVLDFGVGKGRLLSELIAHKGALDRIDYFAYEYDPNPDDKAAVIKQLTTACGDGESRYASGPAKTALADWSGKFDVVIMCNVLHEISPEEWISLFGSGGAVTRSLNDEGHLLLVEDYVLAAGERAHRFGFLLLDEAELAVLFPSSEGEIITIPHAEPKYALRLKAHVISKAALKRMREYTIQASLEALRDRSFQQARSLHGNSENSSKAGHALAVAAHQHLNALLAIESLKHMS